LLLASGAAVNSMDTAGMRPLHMAVLSSDLRLVRLLLAHKADASCVDAVGCTPLHMACGADSDGVVMELLESGAEPGIRDRRGNTPLNLTCGYGRVALAQCMLQYAGVVAHINTADPDGRTPLTRTCYTGGRLQLLRALLAAGADANVKVRGMTPLHYALEAEEGNDRYSCLEALLAAGADAGAVYGAGAFRRIPEGTCLLQRVVQLDLGAVLPLLVTPTHLRQMCQHLVPGTAGYQQQQQQQQQQDRGLLAMDEAVSLIASGIKSLLEGATPGAADCVGQVLGCYTAVMVVLGAAAVSSLLQQVLSVCHESMPAVPGLLLQAVQNKWLDGMPWLQRKWQVTNRLQQLVVEPLQQQALQPQQHSVRHQVFMECVRLWAEVVAAAYAGDWARFMLHQQQLVELRPGWATYPLHTFARWQGQGAAGVVGLCGALLEAWWAAQQQPAGPARAREMADAVVASVQAWEQQRMGISGSSRGR
jgi:hypothetical protein